MKFRNALIACALLVACSTAAAQSSALKFTPHAGDTTVRDFADELGKNPAERQQLAAAINAVKSDVLEREYGAKGWKNNVAGAYAFFVGSLHMAWSGNEPSTAQKDALFAAMSAKMAPALAGVSDREKTALYNTLIASATLPLLLHIDGRQNNNAAELAQARELAAQYSRRIMKMEPQELAGLLQPAADGGPSAAATADAPATPGTMGGTADGEYTCAQLQMLTLPDASGSLQIRWAPGALPPFRISGGRYSAARGGGSVNLANGVIAFSGGAYDGWRGTVGADTRPFIVFNGTDHGIEKSKPGRGDFKCRVNNS